jgi:hypothetical protein
VRFVIDIATEGQAPFEGAVVTDGDREPIAFTGWVELLNLLEAAIEAGRRHGAADGAAAEP